ncbi:MAG: hypothetical protein AAF915_15115 [Cyanobacteria bacterium P01_D01_bin.50]
MVGIFAETAGDVAVLRLYNPSKLMKLTTGKYEIHIAPLQLPK